MAHGDRDHWKHLSTPPDAQAPRPASRSADLSNEILQAAWATLGTSNASQARAASNLIFAAKNAVPFLKEHLKATAADEKKVAQLLKDLSSEVAAVRDKAAGDLVQPGPVVIPQLHAALADAPPPDVRQRLNAVMLKVKATPAFLQGQRGLQVLAELPTKDAQEFFAQIRKQTPETWLTKEAQSLPPSPAPKTVPEPPVPPAPKPAPEAPKP